MDPELAVQLFERGGTLILLDMPENSQFGIDYSVWTTGPKFKGMKMIPPGVHFVYYSSVSKQGSVAPRIGFFHDFKERELMVRKFDAVREELIDEAPPGEDEIESYRASLKELDPSLAPYPYESLKRWFSLSNEISPSLVALVQPLAHGRVTSQCDLVSLESDLGTSTSQTVNRLNPERLRYRDSEGLPILREREGTEIRFTPVPRLKFPRGASASEKTLHSMDTSYALEQMLSTSYSREEDVLGELQFGFICFFIGHVYDAFEHWRTLLGLLCSCDAALRTRTALFNSFVTVVYHQLQEVPNDFFVDIVERNNFLVAHLSTFFALVEDLSGEESSAIAQLKGKAAKFKAYLTRRYKWSFDTADEFEPVVVADSPMCIQ